MENKKTALLQSFAYTASASLELIKRKHGVINMKQVCGGFSSFSFPILACEVAIKAIVNLTIFYPVLCRKL